MWFKNLNFNNKLIDIKIENGIIIAIEGNDNKREGKDYEGRMVLPPLNDPRVHIDSALTAGDPYYNKTGSLFEGIEIWRNRKKDWMKKILLIEQINYLLYI